MLYTAILIECQDDEGDVHVKKCSEEVKTRDTSKTVSYFHWLRVTISVLILKRSQSGNPVDYFNKTFKEYEEGFGDKHKGADESTQALPVS